MRLKNQLIALLSIIFLVSSFAAANSNPAEHFRTSHSKFYVEASGSVYAKGKLLADAEGNYVVDGTAFRIANGVLVNGTGFDKSSLDSFFNKNVEVLLKMNSQGQLELSSIVPADLYSSTEVMPLSPGQNTFLNLTFNSKKGELKGDIRSHLFETNRESFRTTLVSREPVRAGDSAFILTLSGHQGDDYGAKGGHFAFGRGQVGADGKQLFAEISNFYPVVNEKQIKLGHGNIIDYFGHVTSGQSNYRPTWTAIIYGLPESDVAAAQEQFSPVLEFLMQNPNFEFTFTKNCASESANALAAGKVGLFSAPYKYGKISKNVPRKTFEKALGIALSKDGAKFGIKRIDLVYQGQTVSKRTIGGLPIGGPLDLAKLKLFFRKEK